MAAPITDGLVADWVGRRTSDHSGNYYDQVTKRWATVTRATTKTIFDPLDGHIHDVPAGVLALNQWAAYQAGAHGFAPVTEEARTNSFGVSSLMAAIGPGNATFARAASALTIPTYDGSGKVVHPDVTYVPGGWNGKAYWMAFTPFPSSNAAYENPSIVCSDDGVAWAVPDGLTNPIEAAPALGSWADCDMVLGGDGKMHLYFVNTGLAENPVYHRSSSDGVVWSEKALILGEAGEAVVSPAVVWDGSLYRMWYVDETTRTIRYRTSPDGAAWSSKTVLNPSVPGTGSQFWHLDVCTVGGRFYAVIQTDGGTYGLYYAESDDGISWSISPSRLIESAEGLWDSRLYRSTIVPTTDAYGGLRFKVWYNGHDTGNPASFYVGASTIVPTGSVADWTADDGLTATALPVNGIYGLSAGANLAAAGATKAFWKSIGTITAVGRQIYAHVWLDSGAAPTSADCQLCAAAGTGSPVDTLLTTAFAPVTGMLVAGKQVYRATATYTGTAAAWTAGIAVKDGKSVNVALFATDIGTFPTSFHTGTRNADVVTVPTTGWSAEAGTIVMVMGANPAPALNHYSISWRADANNDVFILHSGGTYGSPLHSVKASGTSYNGSFTRANANPIVVAGTWASGTPTQLYVNGVIGSTTGGNSAAPIGLPATAGIGFRPVTAGDHYGGPIHRILVFNRALNATEVAALSQIIGGAAPMTAAPLILANVI